MEQAAQNEVKVITEPKTKSLWRPALAWVYVLICLFDFMLAPIMVQAVHVAQTPTVISMEWLKGDYTKDEIIQILNVMPKPPEFKQWAPLTLQGAGFFHIAMGGILGIGSYTRGREKQMRVEKGVY